MRLNHGPGPEPGDAPGCGMRQVVAASGLRDAASTAATICGLVLALAAGACSLSFPMASLTNDEGPTGSINRAEAALSNALDAEDWRRAKAALGVALDPQGNGADVAWNNPTSGAKGSFVALAPPFLNKERLCRSFSAKVAPPAGTERHLAGSACRNHDGDWVLTDVKDQKG